MPLGATSEVCVPRIQIDLDVSVTAVDNVLNHWLRLDIGNDAKLTIAGEEFHPSAEAPATVAPLLPLLNMALTEVKLTKNGKLVASFASGALLEVEMDERYEGCSWWLFSRHQARIDCPDARYAAIRSRQTSAVPLPFASMRHLQVVAAWCRVRPSARRCG